MTTGRAQGPPSHLRTYAIGHLLVTIGEWSVLVSLLVAAFERLGPTQVGLVSFVAISPYLVLSPVTAHIAQRHAPGTVRAWGMALQAAGLAGAAAAIAADASVWLAVLGVIIAYTSSTALRPAAAVLLPASVRTSRDLTTVNVWVGYGDTAALFLGPFMAMGLLAISGPALALAGSAALSALGLLASWPTIRVAPSSATPVVEEVTEKAALRAALEPFADIVRTVRTSSSRGVLMVAMAQFAVVGASDVIWVVVAGEEIDVGSAGAAGLAALFGAGSLLCSLVSGRAARHTRLTPYILGCLVAIAVAAAGLGVTMTLATALVLIPVMGLSRGLLDVLARVLLQRSAPPSELAGVFGAAETLAGIGGLVGSLLAQVLIGWSGAAAALFGLGALFALSAVSLARSLRAADAAADVPVVQMSLLARLPMFAPLPVWSLETVARSAQEVDAAKGTTVIAEGDHGDIFYAIADGRFEVRREGREVVALERGDGFGEIALLSDVPRTATVTAASDGVLLAIDRETFLMAVGSHPGAHDAAWSLVAMRSGDPDARTID